MRPPLSKPAPGHPGHVLFPAFAGLLAKGTRAIPASELFRGLEEEPRDPLNRNPLDINWDNGERGAKLSTPTMAELMGRATSASLRSSDRKAMLDAMRVAAARRVEGILGGKRRGHYGHAASLVACCLELAARLGQQDAVAEWVSAVRKAYSRFSAFQEECRRALASISS